MEAISWFFRKIRIYNRNKVLEPYYNEEVKAVILSSFVAQIAEQEASNDKIRNEKKTAIYTIRNEKKKIKSIRKNNV